MQQQDVNTGTRDTTYDLISVIYHALQGAENYSIYAEDASGSGDDEISTFLRDLVMEERRRADRAKELLRKRLNREI